MYKPQKAGNSSRYEHSIGNMVILSEEKSGRFLSGCLWEVRSKVGRKGSRASRFLLRTIIVFDLKFMFIQFLLNVKIKLQTKTCSVNDVTKMAHLKI